MKNFMTLLMVLLAVCALGLVGCGGDDESTTSGACSSDNECKGDRVCDNGSCVSPAANNTNPANNTNTGGNNTAGSDVGKQCRTGVADECRDACLVTTGGNDIAGYCSVTCSADDQCPANYICDDVNNGASKYCLQGRRESRASGEQCTADDQCEGELCWGEPGDTIGYCTLTCESFADCPTFWDCEEVDGVAVKVCIQS